LPDFELIELTKGGGLTHVIDKGLGPRAVEDFLETAGTYVDIVKLGWGTAFVTPNLERKLEVYRAFGKPVVVGGTFFEAVFAQGKVERYPFWLRDHGFTHVEISDGVVELDRDRKLELIAELAEQFTVLSEVGSKDSEVSFEPASWARWLKEELDAGAWKVITEAREGGTSGIFKPDGRVRKKVVREIGQALELADVIFEAPTKASQVWFIKAFGPDVNLGNIPPDEVIPLETLRRGLRADTLKEVLLGDRAPAS
jgi:phosphosulfolactate synthase